MIFENMREAYPILAKHVLHFGEPSAPRGQETRELIDFSFIIEDATDTLPYGTNRSMSFPFAAVEAAQLIAGDSRPKLVTRINPTMERFMTWSGNAIVSDAYQHGAYGTRIGKWTAEAVERLKSDRDTRQAILTIWKPELDYQPTPDVPCTLSLHFMIRNDRLLLLTTMRSNDVWWGVPYDVFQFTQLQLTVAHVLGIEAGPYHHRANSFHAYVRDADGIEALRRGVTGKALNHPVGFDGRDDINRLMTEARGMLICAENRREYPVRTDSEEWYWRQLQYESSRAT